VLQHELAIEGRAASDADDQAERQRAPRRRPSRPTREDRASRDTGRDEQQELVGESDGARGDEAW
jgi:hypothetical protein